MRWLRRADRETCSKLPSIHMIQSFATGKFLHKRSGVRAQLTNGEITCTHPPNPEIFVSHTSRLVYITKSIGYSVRNVAQH